MGRLNNEGIHHVWATVRDLTPSHEDSARRNASGKKEAEGESHDSGHGSVTRGSE